MGDLSPAGDLLRSDLPASAGSGSAHPATTTVIEAEKVPSISWVSARSEHKLSNEHPLFWNGVMCLIFGIGAAGADWIGRLSQAEWFIGLEPWAEDLVVSGGKSAGSWTIPPTNAEDGDYVKAEVEAFVTHASLPSAILATIAVPGDAAPRDLAAAISLVSALRKQRDSRGCRMAVVATLEAGLSATPDLVRGLQDQGAFVVQAGLGVLGDFLHHFPLRTPILPPPPIPRLVCVDLTDYLARWRPGSLAVLHVIPSRPDGAARVLRHLPAAEDGEGPVCSLNLLAHTYLDGPGFHDLLELDQLANCCREAFPDVDLLCTTGIRLDGVTGTADLLLIHEPQAP